MSIALIESVGKTISRVEDISPHLSVDFSDRGFKFTQIFYLDASGSQLDPLWDRILRFHTAATYHMGLKTPSAHTL